jgi:hypothetical protein
VSDAAVCVAARVPRQLFFVPRQNNPHETLAPTSLTRSVAVKPLADLPMRRLKLPKGGVGREYLLAQVTIKGQGPYDFMVDSGLTAELITPHLQSVLGIKGGGTKISGLVRRARGGRCIWDARVLDINSFGGGIARCSKRHPST